MDSVCVLGAKNTWGKNGCHQCLLTKAVLSPSLHWQCLDTFLIVMTDESVRCYWHLVREARDAAKHTTVYKILPKTNNYLAQHVSTMEVGKPWMSPIGD